MQAKAALDADGRIVDWNYERVEQHPLDAAERHRRQQSARELVSRRAAASTGRRRNIPQPAGGGDRNAIPLYDFPSQRVVHHLITEMPLRVSALRTLGAYANVFAIESFMDELAARGRAAIRSRFASRT